MQPTFVASSLVRYISETILLPRSPSLWSEWSWFLTRCHSLVPLSRSGVIMGVLERRLSGLLAVLSILSRMVGWYEVLTCIVHLGRLVYKYYPLIKGQFFKMSLLCYSYQRLRTHCADIFFFRSSAEGETYSTAARTQCKASREENTSTFRKPNSNLGSTGLNSY